MINGGTMRRFVPSSTQRAHPSRKQRSCRPVVEAMESRLLFATTPTPTGLPADVLDDTFPISASDGFIQGTVFEDVNNNHVFDVQDIPIPDSEVFIEQLNANGTLINDEIAEPGFTGDLTGSYQLRVPPGTYTVEAFEFSGLLLDPLSTGVAPISVLAQQTVTGKDFGFVSPATISGNVFGDVNANGTRDAGEVGIPNRTVYADINNNGVFDSSDFQAITDTSGNFTLQLPTSGTFTVRIEVPPGSSVTTPSNGAVQITAAPGQSASGADFGLKGPDLTAAFVKTPPPLVIGGQKQKPVEVLVTNVGNSQLQGLVGVSLFASADTTLDASDPQVGVLIGRKLKLVPGKSKILKVPFNAPAGVATGAYHLLAEVISSPADENPANDVAAAVPITNIMQPIVDLNVSYAQQPLLHFDYGAPGFVAVTVANTGNVAFNGMLTLQVYESTDQTLNAATSLAHQTMHVKLPAHRSRVFVLSMSFNGTNRGNFYLITTVDPAAPVADFDQVNNTAVSANQTLIL
jgi:hypothetical protein